MNLEFIYLLIFPSLILFFFSPRLQLQKSNSKHARTPFNITVFIYDSNRYIFKSSPEHRLVVFKYVKIISVIRFICPKWHPGIVNFLNTSQTSDFHGQWAKQHTEPGNHWIYEVGKMLKLTGKHFSLLHWRDSSETVSVYSTSIL